MKRADNNKYLPRVGNNKKGPGRKPTQGRRKKK
jgi:hypothetical protein